MVDILFTGFAISLPLSAVSFFLRRFFCFSSLCFIYSKPKVSLRFTLKQKVKQISFTFCLQINEKIILFRHDFPFLSHESLKTIKIFLKKEEEKEQEEEKKNKRREGKI